MINSLPEDVHELTKYNVILVHESEDIEAIAGAFNESIMGL